MARDRLVIFYPVCPDALLLFFDPSLVVGFGGDMRRGEMLHRPEQVGLVSFRKVFQIVKSLVIDLRRNHQRSSLEQFPIFCGIQQSGSLPASHSIPEKPKSEEAVTIALNDASHKYVLLRL